MEEESPTLGARCASGETFSILYGLFPALALTSAVGPAIIAVPSIAVYKPADSHFFHFPISPPDKQFQVTILTGPVVFTVFPYSLVSYKILKMCYFVIIQFPFSNFNVILQNSKKVP